MPITKQNYLVLDVDDLAKTMREAFHIATTGRPGPVLIDIPRDIQQQETEFHYPEKVDLPSYQPVTKGQLLAREAPEELRAEANGCILLPLYQGQGEDGYFLCRSVRPFWLHLAWLLRGLRLDRLLHWVPGVRSDPQDPNSLLVNPRVARFRVVEILHLLGFRQRRKAGGLLRFARRRARPDSRDLRPRR